ncbi:hypothetical protein SAICODRAFT_157560 [Saitoella complicata NRRL Y-17804]|uniref:uncharacterized protein n=1 Tax=Saitoella complicata (strain BCRC 22490 / CBS 7301 / JCM 7358 / NBRC 10748 / NRRL Y-17804) TaxID=698492 RepID=UPI0008673D9D|nr:uncharacterized protein SAICODRAFT_157560 [Saitoella complicata NRRL Y-17804]ODQ51152.1 hypothetical protein SAICODRAFT_157560 [Saitoella complicata NRRL Y-17804]
MDQSADGNVTVKDSPLFGKAAYAARTFLPGTIVLDEAPLFAVTYDMKAPISKKLIREANATWGKTYRKEAAHGGVVDGRELIWVLELCKADDKIRQRVLDCCNVPDLSQSNVRGATCIRQAENAATTLKRLAGHGGQYECVKSFTHAELLRMPLILAINGHAFGSDGSAVFELGSKLTHTCGSPNTEYSYSLTENRGRHIALRRIQEGELLTTRYLAGPVEMMSAPLRQGILWQTKAFCCVCCKCTHEPDYARGFPCSACTGAWLNPGSPEEMMLLPMDIRPEVVYSDSALMKEGHPNPWSCPSCKMRYKYPVPNIFLEKKMEEAAESLVVDTEEDLPALGVDGVHKRYAMVARILGPGHGASTRMLWAFAEACYLKLTALGKRKIPGEIGRRAAMAAVDEIAETAQKLWSWTVQRYTQEIASEIFVRAFTKWAAAMTSIADESQFGGKDAGLKRKCVFVARDLIEKVRPAIAGRKGWPIEHEYAESFDHVDSTILRLEREMGANKIKRVGTDLMKVTSSGLGFGKRSTG